MAAAGALARGGLHAAHHVALGGDAARAGGGGRRREVEELRRSEDSFIEDPGSWINLG